MSLDPSNRERAVVLIVSAADMIVDAIAAQVRP
jgi:hypothetical protein